MSHSVVIVTDHCYLLCQSINFITINDFGEMPENIAPPEWSDDFRPQRRRRKKITKRSKVSQEEADARRVYRIVIDFIPAAGAPNANSPQGMSTTRRHGDNCTVELNIVGKRKVLKVFKDMIEQIREQMPDQLYLDKLVNKMLTE